jgi:hypothetical protein
MGVFPNVVNSFSSCPRKDPDCWSRISTPINSIVTRENDKSSENGRNKAFTQACTICSPKIPVNECNRDVTPVEMHGEHRSALSSERRQKQPRGRNNCVEGTGADAGVSECQQGGFVWILVVSSEIQTKLVARPKASGVGNERNPIADFFPDRHRFEDLAREIRCAGLARYLVYSPQSCARKYPAVQLTALSFSSKSCRTTMKAVSGAVQAVSSFSSIGPMRSKS